MARPATGQIVERRGADGSTYRSLRFRSGGRRHTVPLGVASRADAERELACVMADVARGLWKPSTVADAPPEIPTFHEYAEDWWLRNSGQLAPKTQTDYRWRLEGHLIPHFGKLPLDAITFDTVERYIAAKLAHGERIRAAEAEGKPIIEHFTDSIGRERERKAQPLSPRSLNMTLVLLAAILEGAVERELILRNPAKGRRRRAIEHAPRRSYLGGIGETRGPCHSANPTGGAGSGTPRLAGAYPIGGCGGIRRCACDLLWAGSAGRCGDGSR